MIKLEDVYGVFLSKVGEDEWAGDYTQEDLIYFTKDWRVLLDSAIFYFKFPRCSVKIDEENECFIDRKMSGEEVEVLANWMKVLWLRRNIDTWDNIKTQYSEAEFSQANLLKTFISLRQQVESETKDAERIYYRSIEKKPFKFGKLCGRGGR